jgi:hypothetical protein
MRLLRAGQVGAPPLNCGVRRHVMRIAGFLVATLLSMPSVGQEPNVPQGEAESASRCSAADLCIRIENASDIDFDKFEVRFPDQPEDFGPLRARGVTGYRKIGWAYDHNYTEATASDRKFYLMIIDHIGDRFVPAGTYTLRYRVNVLAER